MELERPSLKGGLSITEAEKSYFAGSEEPSIHFASPLFLPYNDPAGRQAELAEILEGWQHKGHCLYPLILITHFGPDAREALLALAVESEQVTLVRPWTRTQWICGGDLAARQPGDAAAMHGTAAGALVGRALFRGFSPSPENITKALDYLQTIPPTLFLLDWSEVQCMSVISSPGADGGQPELVAEGVREFYSAVDLSGHRVVTAMPRWALAAESFRSLAAEAAQRDSCFIADELFSKRNERQFRRCRDAIGEMPPPADVKALLSINSGLCIYSIAAFLRKREAELRNLETPHLSTRLALLLAASLYQEGFFEVAFRLEQHCRTLAGSGSRKLVALSADFVGNGERPEVVALIEGLENLPQMIQRAALTGFGGAGKTLALLQIEHEWALPRRERSGLHFPQWLPLFLPLARTSVQGEALADRELRVAAPRGFQQGGQNYRLVAHAVMEKLGSLKDLQWLFSSPAMFLADGFDALPAERQTHVNSQIEELLSAYPEAGLIVAFREGRGPGVELWHHIRVRPLNERQLGDFLGSRGDAATVSSDAVGKLLDLIDKPISRLIRNPYLLDTICHIADAETLEDLNMNALMARYVEQRRREHRGEDGTRIAFQWLPDIALRQKAEIESATPVPAAARFAKQAWEMGFLRTPQLPVQFTHDVLRDYFAARKLAVEFAQRGVECLRVCVDVPELLPEWTDVFRLLIGYLHRDPQCRDSKQRAQRIGDLVRWLAERSGRLALKCALELPLREARDMPAISALAAEMAKRIQDEHSESDSELNETIADGEALASLDPRLTIDNPFGGLVEIPGIGEKPPFQIGRMPVTNLEFSRFVADGAYRSNRGENRWWKRFAWERLARAESGEFARPRYWRNHFLNRPNQPIVGVSFYEALAYCEWLSERVSQETCIAHRFTLPRESHWFRALGLDQAVSLGSPGSEDFEANIKTSVFAVKDLLDSHRHQLSRSETMPVGLFRPTPTGCHDLLGNVWEWCDEWHPAAEEDCPSSAQTEMQLPIAVKGGPIGAEMGDAWILHGGWFDPFIRFHKIGFRICCALR
jgi:formylglycine-generating enzyme required for sulfatase activity